MYIWVEKSSVKVKWCAQNRTQNPRPDLKPRLLNLGIWLSVWGPLISDTTVQCAAFSRCFFWSRLYEEAVWVPKACFQVSLGCRPVAGFWVHVSFPGKMNTKFWCPRMPWQDIWQDAVVHVHITCKYLYSPHNQIFFLHGTNFKLCSILAIKQLPYNPTSKNSKETDYFEVVLLLK